MSPLGSGLAELTRINCDRCSSSDSAMNSVTQIGKLSTHTGHGERGSVLDGRLAGQAGGQEDFTGAVERRGLGSQVANLPVQLLRWRRVPSTMALDTSRPSMTWPSRASWAYRSPRWRTRRTA